MIKRLVLLLMVVIAVAACQPTDDSASDAESAQNLLPNLANYDRNSASNIIDAITATSGSAAAATGNLPIAGAISKIDQVIDCLEGKGAIAAATYVQSDIEATVLRAAIPSVGMSAVINQTRIADNLLTCVASLDRGDSQLRSQSVELEPCASSGTFEFRGETVTYLYVATNQPLCDLFQQHYDAVKTNQ